MIPDKRHALIVLVGAPGSGKSTWGKKFAEENGLKYLSSDESRAKFGKGEEDQSVTPMVFSYLQRVVEQLLEQKKSVMVDATNINRKDRKAFVDAANKHGAYKIAVVFERDKETLKKQVANRVASGGRDIPDFVFDKMLAKYQRPDEIEFDKVISK